MKTDEVIFVLSIQHTGTWFVLDFLKNHPDVTFFSEFHHLLPKHPRLEEIFHQSMDSLSDDYDPELLKKFIDATLKSFPTEGRVLLHQHTQSPRRRLAGHCDGNMCAQAFHGLFKTVIPIRDPLLAMISCYERLPEVRFQNIVDDFEYVIESLSSCCFFLPIDLPYTSLQRTIKLRNLAQWLSLTWDIEYVDDYARRWAPKNTLGGYELKKLYKDRDLAKIAEIIPKRLEYLKSRESFIRPFLECLGYRDLLWWS